MTYGFVVGMKGIGISLRVCLHALPNTGITLNSMQSIGVCPTGIALNGTCSHTLSHVTLPEPGSSTSINVTSSSQTHSQGSESLSD